jgi:ABC-type multidrug transport system fused ATPase/permease subunit
LLLLTSYLATALAALFPFLIAPILDLALGTPVGPASGAPAAGLSLRNLGAVVIGWLGIASAEDRFRSILILCAVYVGVGFLNGWTDFGNYLLALWIRVRAAAAMQSDLSQHLLGLSMSFFSRQRTGELVSRLDADTRAATGGLDLDPEFPAEFPDVFEAFLRHVNRPPSWANVDHPGCRCGSASGSASYSAWARVAT